MGKFMRRIFVTLLASACLAACSVYPVNQDPDGMIYRREANQVLFALQAYHHDRNAFPASLGALVPQYLPSLPDSPELQYTALDGSLAYHYIPTWPQLRPVRCNSVGDTTNWHCEEHLL
jgi:hypothetical protein